jgi:hypothetical protein
MKKRVDYFDLILKAIIVLATILILYWFFQLLFGGSPTHSQFNSILIVMIIGVLFKVYREIGEMKIGIKHSFINMKRDIDLIKSKFDV